QPPAGVAVRGKQGLAERAVGASKRDPLEALAVVAGGDAADVTVADDAGLEEPHRTCGDARAGPAGAVRTGGVERVAQCPRDSAWREEHVEQQRLVSARFLDVAGKPLVDE